MTLGSYHAHVVAVLLLTVITAGCVSRSNRARDPAPPEAGSHAIVLAALDLRGSPYVDGGESPDGFDCSGFTRYLYRQYGVELPRRAAEQFETGVVVSRDALAPGDLVFFTTVAPGASHVGVTTGDGRFVHAPSSRGHVRVEELDSVYWSGRFVGARRILGIESGDPFD